MPDSRISLRDPWTAAILAFLIPGAGHLYQRRFFKAVLYSVCILGTFTYGMAMADWRAVYLNSPEEMSGRRRIAWGYLAQAGVGIPAITAIVQSRRLNHPDNYGAETIGSPVQDHECVALFVNPQAIQIEELSGKVNLDTSGKGSFVGENNEGEKVTYELGGFAMRDNRPNIGPPVASDPNRLIECRVVDPENGLIVGRLRFTIPRPFLNWFEVPPTEDELGELHRMGKIFDLAQVFTWIAGLLNVLAIWDAFAGPAYGYGDESENDGESDSSKAKPDSQKKAAAAAASSS